MELNTKDVLNKYLVNFRVESNRRMSMIGAIPEDIPFYIYDGAHDAAKEYTVSQLELKDDAYLGKMDEVYNRFMELFRENEHYSDTDDIIVKAISDGEFE